MLTAKKVVSGMIGLAMLALPTTALAGHHEERGERAQYVQHDNGLHRGWFKHQESAPVRNFRPIWQSPGYGFNNTPTNPRWRHEDRDGYRPAYTWYSEDEEDEDENYRPVPRWYQNEDEDENENQDYYWGSNYNYGEPPCYYDAAPPSGYGVSQQLSWLYQRRQVALRNLYLMRARHDSRAAGRMAQVLNNINARIRRLEGRGYAPPVAYAPVNPYFGNAYPNSGYGNQYYGNDPTTNLIGSLIGPLLGSGMVR